MKDENNIFTKYKEEIHEAVNDLKNPQRRYRQIPNILTLLRMMAPFFIIPSAIFGSLPLTIGLIAGFSLTDFADGFIARKFDLTSDLGKDLDAICDKVFALTLLLAASVVNPILLSCVFLESVIAGINTFKKINGKETHSTMIGKVKTWFLFSLIGVSMLSSVGPINSIFKLLLPATALMQMLTISSYVKDKDKDVVKKVSLPVTDKNDESVLEESSDTSKEKVIQPKQIEKENMSIEELKSLRSYIVGEQDVENNALEETKEKAKVKSLDKK